MFPKWKQLRRTGKRYQTNYYNLDAIIAVGYRVNSKKATMFRIWANRVLKEFIIKGYVMDDARLREPENFFGKDYFEEQLERMSGKRDGAYACASIFARRQKE